MTTPKIGRPPPVWFCRLALVGLDPDALYTAAEIAILAERATQTIRLVLHARLGKPVMVVVKDSMHLHAAWKGHELIAIGKARLEITPPAAKLGILSPALRKRFWAFRTSVQQN